MSYQSIPVATIINRLNRHYFLPAIQREFVWKPEQVVKLFDSFLCGYPTGTLLFWELKDENRDKYQVYKFVDEFKQGGTHNKTAVTDGVHQLTLVINSPYAAELLMRVGFTLFQSLSEVERAGFNLNEMSVCVR